MRWKGVGNVRFRWALPAIILLTSLLGASVLAGCGGTDPTPQVLVVTATFTPKAAVVVVTATFSPEPEREPSDTPPPSAALEQLAEATAMAQPTATPAAAEPTAIPQPEPTETPTAKPPSLKSYYVVYTAYKGPDLQDYGLWAMNGDGSDAFKIEGAGQASEPAFSPDGDKLAFYHWTDGLYIWDLMKETSIRVVDNSNATFVTWSPNGKRLSYTELFGQAWVYIVNSDGSDNHRLTPGLRPNWSLQGGFIAYDTCENNRCGIFLINPDGGGKRRLTEDGGGGAAVSPDGRKIAYWSQIDGDPEICIINADGTGKRQLTSNRGNDALPAWSPDGKFIYYLSDQEGKGWAVMAMKADGSNQRRITTLGVSPASSEGGVERGWQFQRITVTWND